MNVLVTGAGGFVGRWLVPELIRRGHTVVPGVYERVEDAGLDGAIRLDVTDPASVEAACAHRIDAVAHLAAISSVGEAGRDVGRTYEVNTAGTARVAAAAAVRVGKSRRVRFLCVSTGAVYGGQEPGLRRETDPTLPPNPYAASKLAAETAVLEVGRRTGLEVVVSRPFGHTGAGQTAAFVVPAFTRRIIEAAALGAAAVGVGNLEPVREFMHVSDVVDAYIRLLERGKAGAIYNVASGVGVSMRDLFLRLADLIGVRVIPESDTRFLRAGDIPWVVGDGTRLRMETGWEPTWGLDETLQDVIHAEAH